MRNRRSSLEKVAKKYKLHERTGRLLYIKRVGAENRIEERVLVRRGREVAVMEAAHLEGGNAHQVFISFFSDLIASVNNDNSQAEGATIDACSKHHY